MSPSAISRRQFLAASSGIVLGFALGVGSSRARAVELASVGSLADIPMLDAWLRIGPDGTVTVMTGKVEFGQGILTAIAQIAADELDINLTRVRMLSGDTALCPDEDGTVGSKSIQDSGQAVRYAAAEARQILLELGADELGVRTETLRIHDGQIQAADGRSTSYWALAERNPLHRRASLKVSSKTCEQHSLIGTSVPRLDLPGKFSGVPSYLQDISLPGMLHGRVVLPPAPGMQLEKLDEKGARSLKGIVDIVRLGSFLGVIAEREEAAIAAASALRAGATWSDQPQWPFDDSNVSERLHSLPSNRNELATKTAAVKVKVERELKAVYSKPFIAHASIGPSAAIAHLENDQFSIWSHSQNVYVLRKALAMVLQMPVEAFHLKHAEGAGCYGHNGADDVTLDAALLARAVPGRPVRVQWMRDDEFAWDPYGSPMTMHVGCGLDKSGSIVDWNYEYWTGTHSERPEPPSDPNLLSGWHLPQPFPRPKEGITGPLPAGAGSRNAVPIYALPSHRITEHLVKRMPIRTSSLRCLGAYANIFAIESMMDEAAAATKQDPLAFRLRHMTDERAIRVLRAAADGAGWKPGKQSDGRRGRGIAFSRYKSVGAYVAMVADVEVDPESGKIHCQKITAAVDAGEVINPDGLRNQIEGGIIQGLSWTLKEQVRFDTGQIKSRSWGDYPILTFSEVPLIEVKIIDARDEPPQGVGEPSVPPVGAAIANAVAAATGIRLRELPLTPDRFVAAAAKHRQ